MKKRNLFPVQRKPKLLPVSAGSAVLTADLSWNIKQKSLQLSGKFLFFGQVFNDIFSKTVSLLVWLCPLWKMKKKKKIKEADSFCFSSDCEYTSRRFDRVDPSCDESCDSRSPIDHLTYRTIGPRWSEFPHNSCQCSNGSSLLRQYLVRWHSDWFKPKSVTTDPPFFWVFFSQFFLPQLSFIIQHTIKQP